ncbi:MAG TPA: signal peptidase I [Candidatus Moranbacteria bacterium]|nr:signal peptidase I [Candidatus Moranbacteria bacterium]
MVEKEKQTVSETAPVPEGVGSFVLEVIKIFALAAAIIIPIRVFLFQPFFVQGASMEPNFHGGEYLIINEIGYKTTKIGPKDNPFFVIAGKKPLRRGEAVVFRYPRNPKKYFIKRVIGLPGDRVVISDGTVRIYNSLYPEGKVIKEDYLAPGVKTAGELDETVGKDEYFVMGDNRDFSSDSRVWGMVPRELIVGRVVLRAWPPSRAKIFKDE